MWCEFKSIENIWLDSSIFNFGYYTYKQIIRDIGSVTESIVIKYEKLDKKCQLNPNVPEKLICFPEGQIVWIRDDEPTLKAVLIYLLNKMTQWVSNAYLHKQIMQTER